MSELPNQHETSEEAVARLQKENKKLRAEIAALSKQKATRKSEERIAQIRNEWRTGFKGGLSQLGVSHDLFARGYTYDDD